MSWRKTGLPCKSTRRRVLVVTTCPVQAHALFGFVRGVAEQTTYVLFCHGMLIQAEPGETSLVRRLLVSAAALAMPSSVGHKEHTRLHFQTQQQTVSQRHGAQILMLGCTQLNKQASISESSPSL